MSPYFSVGILAQLALYIPYSYSPLLAVKHGISEQMASTLISVMSISNMFGRIFCGILMDRPWINSILLHNISFLACSASMVCFILCHTYIAFVICSFIYGMVTSIYTAASTVLLVEMFDLENLSHTFGLLSMFKGIATVFSSPLGGFLYEITKTYVTPFATGSVLFLLCFIFGMVTHHLHIKKRKI